MATDPESRPGCLSLGLGGEGAAVPGALHVPSGQPALWLGSCVLWAPQGAELSPPPPPSPAPGGLTWGPLRSCRQLLQPEVQPLGSTAVACGEPEGRPSPAASCRVPRGCTLGPPGRCRVLSGMDGQTAAGTQPQASGRSVCPGQRPAGSLPGWLLSTRRQGWVGSSSGQTRSLRAAVPMLGPGATRVPPGDTRHSLGEVPGGRSALREGHILHQKAAGEVAGPPDGHMCLPQLHCPSPAPRVPHTLSVARLQGEAAVY